MESVESPIKLRKRYTRRLLRNIWRAMRTVRLDFLQGRTPFEGYVYDGVLAAADSGLVRIDEDTTFEAPAEPIDGKTLENFIKKSSTIFEIDRTSAYKNIKTANTTLQYMHAFLFSQCPERVRVWETEPKPLFDDLVVKNLDDTFIPFESRSAFPYGIKVVTTDVADIDELSIAVEYAYKDRNGTEFGDFGPANSKLLLVAAFAPIKADVLNRAVVLTPNQWANLKSINERRAEVSELNRFDSSLMHYRGVSASFQSRELSVEHEPIISPNQSATVFKVNKKAVPNKEYPYLKIRPSMNAIDDSSIDISYTAAQSILNWDHNEYSCLPIHLSTEEERLMFEIFDFIA